MHGDIKPANILIDIEEIKPANILIDIEELDDQSSDNKDEMKFKTTVNFLDIDTAKKIGEGNSTITTLGYISPDLLRLSTNELEKIPTTQARDIFALGVLLTSCINPMLDIESYLNSLIQDNPEAKKDFSSKIS